MIRQLSSFVGVAFVVGVLIAGCGSSSSSTSSSQSSSTPAPSAAAGATTSSTPASTTSSGAGTGAGASSGAIAQEAAKVCQHGIPAAASLPASLKAKLEHICSLAANGHLAASREAARKACVEALSSSAVPAGPEKEKALAACRAK
jgi:hypothetical protein